MKRDYGPVIENVSGAVQDGMAPVERMCLVVDALWEAFGLARGAVSWVGFYLASEGSAGDELVLGPHRDKPACSPIGMHGVCGTAFRDGAVVVDDVRTLGEGYIACDPRDLSEAVVPLVDGADHTWGVLDLDSHEVGAFDQADLDGLQAVLHAAGL
jgi:putative methionine-R-sulfoxide reductase with GAF domain